MKNGLSSLLYWEAKQQAKMVPVVIAPEQDEVIAEIRKTLSNQGFSEKIIKANIKMALSLL